MTIAFSGHTVSAIAAGLAACMLVAPLALPRAATAQALSLPPPPPLPGRVGEQDPMSGRHLRKRVALMPVKVGRLAAELELPGPVIAALVRDEIEGELATAPGLVVLNRAELADVVNEQQLGGSGLFDHELAPPARRLVPAQALLYVTVDDLVLSTQVREDVKSAAEDYVKRAQQVERSAAEAQRRSQLRAERLNRSASPGAFASENDCHALWPCASKTNPAEAQWCQTMKSQCESNNSLLRQIAAQDDAARQAEEHRQIDEQRHGASGLQSEAERLRFQAEWAPTEVSKSVRRRATLELVWKAVDTATGQVIGSGSTRDLAELVNQESTVRAGYQSSSTNETTRVDAVVQAVLDRAISRLVPQIDARLATEPFRAKVVDLAADGRVIVNAGANYGLRRGDSFGVRDAASVLTDPDTGELLTAPGPPVGILWIDEVSEKVAYARVVRLVSEVVRGDGLEWIGWFEEVPGG